MPGLTEVRDAAVDLLETVLPSNVKTGVFSGELSVKVAKSQGLTMRGVFVTALEARNMATDESLVLDLEAAFGAFVLVRGGKDQKGRGQDGLRLAETVVQALHGATFGLPGVSSARVLHMEVLEDEDFEKDGICVWFILWRQGLVFTGPPNEDTP